MLLRAGLAAIAAILLIAADEPPAAPDVLQPYLDEDAVFDPGDFGFLRGAFADGSEADAAAYADYVAWRQECHDQGRARLREDLAQRGYPDASLDGVGSAPLLCRMAGSVPPVSAYPTFAAFTEELEHVRPIYETYLLAMHNAETASRVGGSDLRDQLLGRTIAEQVIRQGLNWGRGAMSTAPEISPEQLMILRSALGAELMWHDDDNTRWLKSMVAEHGWPRISEVGRDASHRAWLIAQHADADPLFQLEALQMMEPLVGEGEVLPRDFAYLYDRVMLKLAGRQRYGTQMYCPAGEFEPQPLEDEERLDEFREQVGLDPIAEYRQMMNDAYGPCTPPPTAPGS